MSEHPPQTPQPVDEPAPTPPSDQTIDERELERWLTHDPTRMDRYARLLSYWYWDHVYRLRAHHVERVPVSGAFILAGNHSSYCDPFLHVRRLKLRRLIRFMAKSTLFDLPVAGWIVAMGGGFPVRRGQGDAFAMELARRMLLDGQPLVIYPEGTRFRRSAELGPAKRGAARLALETGSPVVPVATWGIKDRAIYGRRRWQRPRATMVYGEPISVAGIEPTRENVDALNTRVWNAVGELYEQARVLDEQRDGPLRRRRRRRAMRAGGGAA